jgi:hypothetical protein
MIKKSEFVNYIPLFEQHTAFNNRFAALPEGIKEGLAKVLDIDAAAVVTGELAQYMLGECDVNPGGIDHIDIIVADADKFRPHAGMLPAEPEPGDDIPVAGAEMYPDETVIMSLSPDGEIEEIARPEEKTQEEFELEMGPPDREFESLTWLCNSINGAACSVNVFEGCSKIKAMPMTLGNITVLVDEPGVIAEYVKKFATMKGGNKQGGNVKREKSAGYDKTKKQPHVEKENDMQNTPKQQTKPLFVQFKIKRKK